MNKKHILILSFITLLCGFYTVGCKKYVNDTLTKRKFNKYITGTWKMTKYEVDSIDSLPYFTFYGNDEFVIDKENITIKGRSYNYEWSYSKNIEWFVTGYPFYSVEKYIDTIIVADTTFVTVLDNSGAWKIDALTNDEFVISQWFGYGSIFQQHKITCFKTEK